MKKTTPVLVVVVSALSMTAAFLANTFDVGAQSAAGQMPRDRKPAPSVAVAQDAEETRLQRALAADPSNVDALRALGALYNRTGRFELAVQSFERVATLRPADPEAHHVVGTYYFEKTRDQTLTPETKQAYIERGIAAEDEALAINPDYMEALVYKNLLLRVQALNEPDPVRKQALVSQADALRNKALQLQRNRSTGAVPAGAVINVGSAPPPPPPPPPPGGAMKAAVAVPVTVKCRLGIDDQDPEHALAALAAAVEAAGVDALMVHARKAWLTGLDPKQNREIPPLDHDRVYRLKLAHPRLEILLNGGIETLEQAKRHLAHVDGAMMGRAAYREPWRLLDADPALFDTAAPFATPKAAASALIPYIERALARGARLHSIVRHLHGLFHAVPGARAFRRHLATAAVKPGAGAEVVADALAMVVDVPGEPARTAAA